MNHLYVCRFSNGFIKVGRSVDPKSRVASHAERIACVGIELVEHNVFECVNDVIRAESELISFCKTHASKQIKNEWFDGLDFNFVSDAAKRFSATIFPIIEKPISKPKKQQTPEEIAESLLEHQKYIARCRYQYVDGAWVDKSPLSPHWPDSQVERWDLRPDDWHMIWPELITHPCSRIFAPKHPNRQGDRSIGDWIASWPTTFRPNEELPNIVEPINKWDADGSKRQMLRPDDWQKIWPELIEPIVQV